LERELRNDNRLIEAIVIGNPYPMPIVNGQRLSSNSGMENEVKEIAKILNSNAVIKSKATIDKLKESIRESPNTGKGQIKADGLFGLSRALLIAGASIVIVSL
jgi:CHAT domain-containing protein